jgi:hypothetical protein
MVETIFIDGENRYVATECNNQRYRQRFWSFQNLPHKFSSGFHKAARSSLAMDTARKQLEKELDYLR